MDNELQDILNLVSKYIKNKHAAKKWEAGKDWVQYAGPYFDDSEYVSSIKSLLNEWLVLGELGHQFETKFSPLLGKRFGILTNSGSSANLIMMSAMTSKRLYNFPRGTTVITPIAGFPTTFNPILQVGFDPLFVDIDLDTLNLNLDQVEEHAKNGAKIITFAHVLGNPPNMTRLMEIVNKYNLIFLEDCCDALGSTYDGKLLGSFGELASCSFYPAHHFTMGEGGFVASNTKLQEDVTRNFISWGRSCFTEDAKVISNERLLPIKDIKIGDLVTTHTGKEKKVVDLFSKHYTGDYYYFTLKSKGDVHSTDYHPHLIYRNNEFSWIEAKDIKIGDEFVEKIPETTVFNPEFTWSFNTDVIGIKRDNKLTATPDLMRLIGYWLTEGCVARANKGSSGYKAGKNHKCYTVQFSFHKDEIEYIDDVKVLMKKYFGTSGYYGDIKNNNNGRSIWFKSRKAYEFFNQHFGKYAYNKSLPNGMVNWETSLLQDLVTGYWRGDGSYCKNNKSFSIASTSPILIDQIRRIMLKFDVISGYCVAKKETRQNIKIGNIITGAKHDLHYLTLYGANSINFEKNILKSDMYEHKSDDRYTYICNDGYVHYPVKEIEIKQIDETVYNLEVEDDNSYHVNGVATHNCTCFGKKASLAKNGMCGKRFSNWLPELPDEIIDHKYVYDEIGYNLKPLELQAAIGLEQLKKLPEMDQLRKRNHKLLYDIFAPYEEFFILPKATPKSDPSWFAFALTIKENKYFKRKNIIDFLESHKIQTRPYFAGCLLLNPAYEGMMSYEDICKNYPNARKVTTDTFFLGVSPVITVEQIAYIKRIVDMYFTTLLIN